MISRIWVDKDGGYSFNVEGIQPSGRLQTDWESTLSVPMTGEIALSRISQGQLGLQGLIENNNTNWSIHYFLGFVLKCVWQFPYLVAAQWDWFLSCKNFLLLRCKAHCICKYRYLTAPNRRLVWRNCRDLDTRITARSLLGLARNIALRCLFAFLRLVSRCGYSRYLQISCCVVSGHAILVVYRHRVLLEHVCLG